ADELRSRNPFPVSAGGSVLAVLTHPLPMGLMRSLVPSQRLSLATDWATAAAELRHRYDTIRHGLRRSVPRRGINRRLRGTSRWLRANPEWVLVPVVAAFLFLGWLRMRPGS